MEAVKGVADEKALDESTEIEMMHSVGWGCWIAASAFLVVGYTLAPDTLVAQTIAGRVLEEGREQAVAGALISLVSSNGAIHRQAIADAEGRFQLGPEVAGEYTVEVARLGYQTTRSPRLAMAVSGRVEMDFLVTPLPVGLAGLEVSVEAEGAAVRALAMFGLKPEMMGPRYMGPEEIRRIVMPSNAGELISRKAIPGLRVDDYSVCARYWRAATVRSAKPPCAITVLDGAIVDMRLVGTLDASEIEAVAFLQPIDATTFFGTMGGSGALMVWTRRGRVR